MRMTHPYLTRELQHSAAPPSYVQSFEHADPVDVVIREDGMLPPEYDDLGIERQPLTPRRVAVLSLGGLPPELDIDLTEIGEPWKAIWPGSLLVGSTGDCSNEQ